MPSPRDTRNGLMAGAVVLGGALLFGAVALPGISGAGPAASAGDSALLADGPRLVRGVDAPFADALAASEGVSVLGELGTPAAAQDAPGAAGIVTAAGTGSGGTLTVGTLELFPELSSDLAGTPAPAIAPRSTIEGPAVLRAQTYAPDRLPYLLTYASGEGRASDGQLITIKGSRAEWLTDVGAIDNTPIGANDGSITVLATAGNKGGAYALWLAKRGKARVLSMAFVGWPGLAPDNMEILWPEDPDLLDGVPSAMLVRQERSDGRRSFVPNTRVDNVSWVRAFGMSPDGTRALMIVNRPGDVTRVEAVLMDITNETNRVVQSVSAPEALIGPVSFSPDGATVSYGRYRDGFEQQTVQTVTVADGTVSEGWGRIFSAQWWNNRFWALRADGKNSTILLAADSPQSEPTKAATIGLKLGGVRLLGEKPKAVGTFVKATPAIALVVDRTAVPANGKVRFRATAAAANGGVNAINAATGGVLQRQGSNGQWKKVQEKNSGKFTVPVPQTTTYRWCLGNDLVLAPTCSDPVTISVTG